MKANNIISDKAKFLVYSENIVNGYNDLEKIWRAVLETAKEMHGKVFNKRFGDAINAKISGVGSVSFNDPYNMGYKTLNIWVEKRYYTIPGIYGCNYFDDDLSYKSMHNANDILTDGRIDATKAAEKITDYLGGINRKRDEMKDAAKNYDKNKKKLENAVRALAVAFSGINPLFVPSELRAYDWEKTIK